MNVSVLILPAALLLILLMSKTDAKMEIISSKKDIHVGEEILLLCKAGGEGDIIWKKDDEEITEDEKVSKMDETSSKLVIGVATMADKGTYTCWCEFDNGHTDEITFELFIHKGPSFGQTKEFYEFLQGTTGTMSCLVTGEPAVEISWLKDNKQIPRNDGSHLQHMPDDTLRIDKVREEDAGTYTCKAQIKGRPVYKSLPVSVVVNVPPTVRLKEEEKKVLAGPETNVTLLCLVGGFPKPYITWILPTIDSSRQQFNTDRSQLIIKSVTRSDYGEYVCIARNKISESNATIMLHVFEAPEVFVSVEEQRVSVGERVSVSCNVSGHPQPELHWINKHNGRKVDTTSGHFRISEGVLEIEEMEPSDGGLYSCMAVSTSGNASRDVAIHTQPGPPHSLSTEPRRVSILFSLKSMPLNGGTPITGFVLQWKQEEDKQWNETTIPVSEPLLITNLKQYTSYMVRLAASNVVGVGEFSENKLVRTKGIREPDAPVLSTNNMKVERNTFYIPLRQVDQGASPVQHFNLRYRKDKDGADWIEMKLSPSAHSISLQDLSFGSGYEAEVTAVNVNGSSIPGTFNFTIAEQPVSRSMTKGSVVGIVIVIFLVVFLIVDATCCYKNHCGLLMSIAVKLFGQKVPGMKMFDDGSSNGEVNLKGMSTPRGSLQMGGVKKEAGELTEVTCDKVSLTKNEKTQPDREKQAVSA